jgi:hypothetical protein
VSDFSLKLSIIINDFEDESRWRRKLSFPFVRRILSFPFVRRKLSSLLIVISSKVLVGVPPLGLVNFDLLSLLDLLSKDPYLNNKNRLNKIIKFVNARPLKISFLFMSFKIER